MLFCQRYKIAYDKYVAYQNNPSSPTSSDSSSTDIPPFPDSSDILEAFSCLRRSVYIAIVQHALLYQIKCLNAFWMLYQSAGIVYEHAVKSQPISVTTNFSVPDIPDVRSVCASALHCYTDTEIANIVLPPLGSLDEVIAQLNIAFDAVTALDTRQEALEELNGLCWYRMAQVFLKRVPDDQVPPCLSSKLQAIIGTALQPLKQQ